jgi:two-component system OmpR family sensor kinase
MATDPRPPTAPAARPWSLQSRLRKRLLIALGVLWLAAAIGALVAQQIELQELLDDGLEDSAERLLSLPLALSAPEAAHPPRQAAKHEQDIEMQLFDREGRLLWRSHEAPVAPLARLDRGGLHNEGRWRAAVEHDEATGRVALAAQKLVDRADTVAAALPWLLLPLLGLLPLAALIVHLLLRQGFRSLEPTRDALARRDGTDLSPLPAAALPKELQPLVEAIDALLARLGRLLAAERQFAATSAHELRTPLAAAQAQLQRLLQELPAGSAAEPRAEALQRQLRRLADLSAKLLQFARVDAGVALAREPVDLRQLVHLVLDEFREGGSAAAERWTLDLPAAPVWVRGDLDALGMALRNLVENAQRHAGEAARLTLTLTADARLAVEDDGPGVPAAQLAALKKPFQRGPAGAPEGGSSGSGLGLAIADAVARQSQGSLALQSPVREGRGFRATLALPLSEAAGASLGRGHG